VSRLNSDIMVIQDSLSTNISMVARGVVFVAGSLIIMLWIQWQLGLVTCVAMIPIVLLNGYFNHYIRNLQREIQQEQSSR
jgi:ABC-type multidrug transport system fused ATPase/permease subunit